MHNHPEMINQESKIKETLLAPNQIVRSITDSKVELFYKFFENSPVNSKYLCVVVKSNSDDYFIIAA